MESGNYGWMKVLGNPSLVSKFSVSRAGSEVSKLSSEREAVRYSDARDFSIMKGIDVTDLNSSTSTDQIAFVVCLNDHEAIGITL